MEVQTVKEILAFVNESITTITKVLEGTEMLTAKTQKEATELLKGAVPTTWESKWEGPMNPSEWILFLNKKALALLRWLQKSQQGQLLEGAINLSDLIHPETFLNALRQKSARKLKIAIDELKLVSSFEKGKIRSETAIAVEGLLL